MPYLSFSPLVDSGGALSNYNSVASVAFVFELFGSGFVDRPYCRFAFIASKFWFWFGSECGSGKHCHHDHQHCHNQDDAPQ
jgi:hypothetical protein